MRSIQSKNGLGHQALLKCKKKKRNLFPSNQNFLSSNNEI